MKESSEVRALAESILTHMNAETWIGHLGSSDGVLSIGSDPEEWWEGREAIASIWRTQMQEMEGFGVRPAAVQAYEEGSVGWFADRPVMTLPDGTDVEARITGVAHQENGAWKLVQLHFSVGAANEEVIGTELTT